MYRTNTEFVRSFRRESVQNFNPQQCEGVEELLPYLERALRGLPKYGGPIVLCDFGVSGGKACVPLVKKVQEEVFPKEKPLLYLNDREENDWSVTEEVIREGLGDSVTAHVLAKDMYTRLDD